jgi:hypothetical protein
MPKSLYIIIPIVVLLFLAKPAAAGIIIRPVLNTGLVCYWDFQDTSKNVAYDKSGYGNNGSLVNSPARTTGKIGYGLNFIQGSSQDVVDSNGIPEIASASTMTMSAWIRRTTASYQLGVGADDAAGGNRVAMT